MPPQARSRSTEPPSIGEFVADHQRCDAGVDVARENGSHRGMLRLTCKGCGRSMKYRAGEPVQRRDQPVINSWLAPAPEEDLPAADPVASYVLRRGPQPRQLTGFFVLHASCPGGFDFVRNGTPGEGGFDAVCRGCGKRCAYASPALEAAPGPVRE